MSQEVKVAEIAKALDVTNRFVNIRATKENWSFRAMNKRGDKAFDVARLPEDVRLALAKRAQPTQLMKQGPRFVGSPDLPEWANKVALARADLIRAYLKEKDRAKRNGGSKMDAAESFIKGYNTGHLMPQVFEAIGITKRQTVEGWVKAFRDANYDYAALAPRWGNRKGQRKVTEEEFNTMLAFALHPNRLRIAEVVRAAKMALQRKGIASPSSADTLRRALEDWKKANYDKWVFARMGEKALNDLVLPYMERDAGLLDVGEVLVADGHVLNFQILHPFTGKPCRAMLLCWYDWASAMPAGWEIMPTENVQAIAAGLRRAILNIGKIPKVAYLDNGKAFKAKVFTDQAIDFEEAGFYGMFARLGMETVFAWPYHGQSKPIERFFGTFSELERLMPTFVGTSIQDKPARMLRSEKLHKRIHEKKYGGWCPTIEEANRIIHGWVKEYAARPHRGLKGLCPGDVLEAGRGEGVDEGALRHLMMSIEIKTIGRNGVRFMGRDYYHDALYGRRDRVMIKYDFDDLSRVLVYDVTGARQICEAEATRAVHPMARLGTPEDMALVKEGIKRKRALKRGTEGAARAYVEDAPDLVLLPEREIPPNLPLKKGGEKALTRPEAERIEAEAAGMKVLELRPKERPIYQDEAERYEDLLIRQSRGEDMPTDDMAFMRYFETTGLYKSLKERFEFVEELHLMNDLAEMKGGDL